MTESPAPDPIRAIAHPPPTDIRSRAFHWGERTFVMGIINVTPDSFSGDGLLAGAVPEPTSKAVATARQMVADGADLLDVGGESTRPGHAPVDEAEEVGRIVPVIRAVRAALPDVPISVDTTKLAVAEAALDAGADLINDVWGVGADEALASLAARRRVPLVVVHNRAEAHYADLIGEVIADLRAALERAVRAGVPSEDLIVDPGIGFGKTADQNVRLLRELGALRVLGHPILLGTSRKSTIGRILDSDADQRLEGTLATTALGIALGADMVRVHDVLANVRAARVSDAIIRDNWRAAPTKGGPR